MATEVKTSEKTFDALLSEAPLYQKSDTVTLTGALARSPEEGKFALMQADGSAVTLDSSAVKSHTVIGSSFGQQIVQVELDAEKVPKEAAGQSQAVDPLYVDRTGAGDVPIDHRPDYVTTFPLVDHPVTNPFLDEPHTLPYADIHTGIADNHTGVLNDTINTGIADHHTALSGDVPTLPGDPGYPQPTAGYLPFSLATGHQAPAEAMARMEALAYASPLAQWQGTNPNYSGDKTPRDDGTYPIRLPYGRTVWHYDM